MCAQAEPVAVLSHGVWRTRYQGDPEVVGKPVRVNGLAGTIIGVMPEGFAFPENTEVWTNMRLDPLRIERGQGETLEVMGRLRDGLTVAAAQAEIEGITKAIAKEMGPHRVNVNTVSLSAVAHDPTASTTKTARMTRKRPASHPERSERKTANRP